MQEKLKQFFSNSQNQRYALIVGAVIILAFFGYLVGPKSGQENGTPKGAEIEEDSPATLQLQTPDAGQNKVVESTTQKPTLLPRGDKPPAALETGTPPPRPDAHDGLTFEEAMKLFGLFGYRYQFVNCRGTPGNFIMKIGTRFMLDNRDPVEHNIGVASRNFLIPGYDFVVTYAQDLGKFMITCDGGGASSMEVVP